jgi:hypothetical protein
MGTSEITFEDADEQLFDCSAEARAGSAVGTVASIRASSWNPMPTSLVSDAGCPFLIRPLKDGLHRGPWESDNLEDCVRLLDLPDQVQTPLQVHNRVGVICDDGIQLSSFSLDNSLSIDISLMACD